MMRDFAKFVTAMYNNRYSLTMSRLLKGRNGIETHCAFFCINVTPRDLSIVSSLRAQKFNVNHIVTLFSPEIENNSGAKIVLSNEIKTLFPAPEYLLIGNLVDFVFASKIPGFEKRVIIVANRNGVNALSGTYDTYMKHLAEIYDFRSSLIDKESRRVFEGFLMARISGNLSDAIFADTPQYICEGFEPNVGDIFIDGGACDGYTAGFFADRGCKVYSFEPDRKNFEIASALGKEKGFIVENFGLGSSNREERYTHVEGNIGSSHLDKNGNETADIVTLDSYVAKHQLPSVDFIKLDVEGYELDVLKGAAKSIKKFKPKMAVCAYHKHEDLWTLMPYIKSLRPDYEFAFRHYPCTHEESPYLITENIQQIFDFFGVDGRVPSTAEGVLFCR